MLQSRSAVSGLQVIVLHLCRAAQGVSLATRLHFEFYSEAKQDQGDITGQRIIDLQRLDQKSASEHDLFCQLVNEYQVPQTLRYVSRNRLCILGSDMVASCFAATLAEKCTSACMLYSLPV